jgi:hypothetical protein
MAASMLNSYRPTQRQDLSQDLSLEACIRMALESGELSSSLKAQINSLTQEAVTAREQVLLQILQDAIQDGCIQEAG